MFAFYERDELREYLPLLYKHFDRFGMEIHKAPKGTAEDSKSEVLFMPAAFKTYDVVDLTTKPPTFGFKVDGEVKVAEDFSEIPVDEHHSVPVVTEFKYLGSHVDVKCTDELQRSRRKESRAQCPRREQASTKHPTERPACQLPPLFLTSKKREHRRKARKTQHQAQHFMRFCK